MQDCAKCFTYGNVLGFGIHRDGSLQDIKEILAWKKESNRTLKDHYTQITSQIQYLLWTSWCKFQFVEFEKSVALSSCKNFNINLNIIPWWLKDLCLWCTRH